MLFSIEGNIGSGKSTLVNLLKKEFDEIADITVRFVDEPVNQWEMIKNEEDKNMIELFYSDPKKYAFAFQMMAYISRLAMIHEAILLYPNDIIITERCLLTDYHVFAKLLHENKEMLDVEFKIYQKWFYYFQQEIEVTGFIYVRTTPEIAYERCLKRARPGETISLEYLKQCHQKHEEWVAQESLTILRIDNDDAEPEEALWEIHDYIADYIWEMEEPELNDWNLGPFFPVLAALAAYALAGMVLFYQLGQEIDYTKEILNYQKMR